MKMTYVTQQIAYLAIRVSMLYFSE